MDNIMDICLENEGSIKNISIYAIVWKVFLCDLTCVSQPWGHDNVGSCISRLGNFPGFSYQLDFYVKIVAISGRALTANVCTNTQAFHTRTGNKRE